MYLLASFGTLKEKMAPVSSRPPLNKNDSSQNYIENEVNIHYRSPIRQEIKEYIPEDELAFQQAEAMRKIYEEEKHKKYIQELQDLHSRRHTDNFTPSQKSPIPLNRYDEVDDFVQRKNNQNQVYSTGSLRNGTANCRLQAKALYTFQGQTPRELSFKKGDTIYIRRQIDRNWFEGEHNAVVGWFPANYVDIVPSDYTRTMSHGKKGDEGQARAKFNFIAQTHLELSLAKGELVIITRRVDDNWFEGRIGTKKGIFPVSYVDVLSNPGEHVDLDVHKPAASPAAHSLVSSSAKQSMGSHHYQPLLSTSAPPPDHLGYHHAKPVQVVTTGQNGQTNAQYGSILRGLQTLQNGQSVMAKSHEPLHINVQTESVPYRAVYKYKPQNDDELELFEGDIVYVLEKCDDGWYVGSNQRTGMFGTFPGNYVELAY